MSGSSNMNTESLARSYYRLVNAKDIEGVLSLFISDAQFTMPDGTKICGTDSIREMYVRVFEQGGPQPQPVNIVAGNNAAAAQVEVTLANGTVLGMASFFRINDQGQIESVDVYRRA